METERVDPATHRNRLREAAEEDRSNFETVDIATLGPVNASEHVKELNVELASSALLHTAHGEAPSGKNNTRENDSGHSDLIDVDSVHV